MAQYLDPADVMSDPQGKAHKHMAKHIPGKKNVIADALSCKYLCLPGEWSFNQTVFAKLCFILDIELFATNLCRSVRTHYIYSMSQK